MRNTLKIGACSLILLIGTVGFAKPSFSILPVDQEKPLVDSDQEPVDINILINYEPKEDVDDDNALPFDIREDALKEAALSFGARGGLAKRTWEIRKELDTRSRYLDKVYDFQHLLIAAPSGFMIEPPIVTEAMNAMIVDFSGQEAAVSDRIYNIIKNARIVSAPRNWRQYLEREWGEVIPPPDILLPRDDDERQTWEEFVRKGWKMGYEQADEIFNDDLSRLTLDFEGMVRYKLLLAQGMVSPPYALQVDRGITGGGEEMKVGDRAVQITGVPEFVTGADQWKPANQ
ncbi:MAG: type IV secretion system DotC family protein [Rhodospirillales bacterium]|nr:type IV secretion system DotC family protein [Alphaproteobacteria bacterium]MCB1839950.1 type IV secretion system DotC family protein [Alphaproteobacteria bacterium]MCB9977547.1 type IV secretion system DotC family protein [Rhodospirillales bacterium]